MILQRRLAGLAVGLLVALVAAPAFAAGRTTPLDPTSASAANRAIAQRPQLGVFPQDGNLEKDESTPAARIETSPADLQALFVPPGHVASPITSIANGNWDAPGTWSGGSVPTSADDVTIADGTTVTVNAAGACASLTVGQGISGILIWEVLTARTLTVVGNVSVSAGGSMLSAATGSQILHVLSLGGNLANSGTIDFSTSSNNAGVGITFTGAANATFTGSGSTDLRALTLNKGTSAASILEFAPNNYSVRGSTTSTSGYLTITNGMFKLAGTFGGSNPVGAIAGWTIPATGGVWFTNPNYTISAQNGTIVLNGALVMDSGTFNVGNSSGNRLAHALGSSVLLRGGAINISGRFSPNSSGVVYNQSGGTMTVTTVDNASSANAGFEMNSGCSFTMSGGSIVLQKASTALSGPRDYRNLSSTVNITGGTLQIGNASSGVAQTFFINGVAPAITLTNTSGNHTATQLGEVDAFGPTVLASGTKLTLNGQVFVERGASLTNDGTIDAGVANSALYWFASSPQSYGGGGIAGTVAAPLPSMYVDNLTSLTLSPLSPQIIATRVNMFTGGVVNANRLQLGVGGTSVAVTQIGVGGNLFQGGTYDVAPTFAYGTGGYNLFYASETVARTTAAEVPASRAVGILIVDNEHDVALAGGDLAAQTVQFPAASKNLTTGANTLAVNAGGTLTRVNATTSGWVAGNLKKDAPAGNSTRAFEIGDATSYAPVSVDLVGVAAPGSLSGRSDSGDLSVPAGSGIDGSKSVNRNWTLSGSPGLSLTSATGTFNFPGAEVDGGANTANFIVRKLDGSTWSGTTAGTRTATSTQATWNSGFSSFAIGEVASYAVNVTTVGSGSVAKFPDQATYVFGSSVDLTATPAAGWHFVGWSGDASGSANPLTVSVDAAKNITATFAINQYAVNVTVVGNGSVAKDPDLALYDHGSSVELTATPAAGWHFVGWSGDVISAANPVNVTVDAAKNITATFAINQYAVDVTVVGSGSVGKDPDQPLYDYGSSVDLTATPAVGWHFVGWSGDASGNANPLSVNVNAAKAITATFALNQYAVDVTVVGSGSVAKDPDQPLYDYGSSVELTATPAAGWNFIGWSGDASGNANPLSVNVNAAKAITATFALNQYAVNVTVVGSGSVAKDPDQALYDEGANVELTATPAVGWHFVGWTGDVISAVNPLNVTVDASKNITATFALNQYAVNVTVVGSGSVAKDPDQPLYDYGSNVELTATPAAGWHFVGWTGDVISGANPVNVTVDAAKNITATFAINQYAVNVTVVGNGSVAKDPDQPLYDYGSNVELTATAAVGWHFVGWTGDVISAVNPLNVTVDAAKNITATFAVNQYAVNVTVVGNGSVAKDPDQPLYDYGSNVELTATPAVGWHFVGWSGDVISAVNPLNVTVDAAKNITATFAINQYAVNVTVVGSGSVAKDPDQPLYDYGSSVELTATPAVGWHFVGWSGDASGNANPLSVLVNGAKDITATFAANQYAVNVSVVGSGSVARNPDQASYDYGSSVELTATPAVGWHFVGWSGDAGGNANPLSVLVDGVKNITATFEINTYTLTINIVGGGAVGTNPVQASYDYGSSVQLSPAASPGWSFAGWSGNAGGNSNPLTVVMNSNKSITATFVDVALPTAHLLAPNTGGEVMVVGVTQAITWTASDNVGVTSIDLLLSRTGAGGPYEVIASGIPNSGSYDWVATGPATANGVISVIASDAADNAGSDSSDELLEIVFASVGVETPVLKIALLPVVPSPSVTSARLRYELPKDAQVDLSIVDVRGREVAKLVHGVQPAGRHAATWNGQTPSGRAPAGVYFARFLSSGARLMQRIVLLR